MLPRVRTVPWLLLLIFVSACAPKADSEEQTAVPADPRLQAQIDMSGEDLQGRDGPLIKIGYDLALLYREFELHSRTESAEAAAFVPSDGRLRVSDGLVAIDAVASGASDTLLQDLRALGLVDGVAFGRRVSGRLPLGAIAEMAALDSLQSARPVLVTTR